MNLLVESTVEFSPCWTWRYVLIRRWAKGKLLCFFMLNPSTADAIKNDPTIERCCRRARMMGYAGVVILNVYAFRSPHPSDLWSAVDPVGPDNDMWIERTLRDVDLVICGWGAHPKPARLKQIARLFKNRAKRGQFRVTALTVNADGSPKHPLYCGYKEKPVDYEVV